MFITRRAIFNKRFFNAARAFNISTIFITLNKIFITNLLALIKATMLTLFNISAFKF